MSKENSLRWCFLSSFYVHTSKQTKAIRVEHAMEYCGIGHTVLSLWISASAKKVIMQHVDSSIDRKN